MCFYGRATASNEYATVAVTILTKLFAVKLTVSISTCMRTEAVFLVVCDPLMNDLWATKATLVNEL